MKLPPFKPESLFAMVNILSQPQEWKVLSMMHSFFLSHSLDRFHVKGELTEQQQQHTRIE